MQLSGCHDTFNGCSLVDVMIHLSSSQRLKKFEEHRHYNRPNQHEQATFDVPLPQPLGLHYSCTKLYQPSITKVCSLQY